MKVSQKLAILEFSRAFNNIHKELNDIHPSGFEVVNYKNKDRADLDYILIGTILNLDFNTLYCDEVLNNCAILHTDFLKPIGFTWWNLGDSLVDLVFQFCDGGEEICEQNLIYLENRIKLMYINYKTIVNSELPPEILQGCVK